VSDIIETISLFPMKKRGILFCYLTILMITHLLLSSCNHREVVEGTPDCIIKEIQNFQKDMACESGAFVIRYWFNDQYVYLFNPGPCGADFFYPVYDEECNLLCNLGGIAGFVDCMDMNFYDNSTDGVIIWFN